MTLTVTELKALTQTDVSKRLGDKDGIYGIVRARADGAVSVLFRWRFRFGGKLHDFTCGTWPNDSLADIRGQREWAFRQLQESKNPNIEKNLIKQRGAAKQFEEVQSFKADTETSVKLLFAKWQKLELVKRGNKGRKDGGAEALRSFTANVFPSMGDTPVKNVTRAACMAILNEIKLRNKMSMANHLLADMSQFFGWCEMQGMIDSNPLRYVTKKAVGGSSSIGERHLSIAELVELKKAIPNAKLQDSTEIAIWIMLGTACRVGEISRARWDEVDIENRRWTIPPDNAKNTRQHIVHLSGFSVSQFERLRLISGSTNWCFPASNKDDTHVCVKSITKQIYDRQRSAAMKNRSKATGALRLSNGSWTPHDLRRTAATQMGELKVSLDIINRTLNHFTGTILDQTYNKSKWFEEQRAAWEILGTHLEKILNKESVATQTQSVNIADIVIDEIVKIS